MLAAITPIDAGDTAWMLVATALVLMMTPALGLFYAGLVRSKNTLNTFMMCVAALAVATITWALVGYSLAFADGSGFVGGLGHAFLNGVGFEPRAGTKIPHLVFFAFQATFCIVTTALIAGAVVERMRFGPFLVFSALWSVLVYGVLAHWAFGGGWLQSGGTLDFAGGIPVEMGSGFSALAAALVVGAVVDWVVDFSVVSLMTFIALSIAPLFVMPRTQVTFSWMFCLYWSSLPAQSLSWV